MRLPGAEVVRPDLVGVGPKEELHGVHVPLGQVDNMNVVPGHGNDYSSGVTINIHGCVPGLGTFAIFSVMHEAHACSVDTDHTTLYPSTLRARLYSPGAGSVRRVPVAPENAQLLPHPDGHLLVDQ